jgi:hypothetical protein
MGEKTIAILVHLINIFIAKLLSNHIESLTDFWGAGGGIVAIGAYKLNSSLRKARNRFPLGRKGQEESGICLNEHTALINSFFVDRLLQI